METANETRDADEGQRPQPAPRPRLTNACEACRAAKVKCQTSNQLGICKRCLDSKRECFFKTGPRTRRPRQAKRPPSTTTTTSTPLATTTDTRSSSNPPPTPQQPLPGKSPLPPPPGPSKTFTIDIPMPVEDEVTTSFDELRIHHEDIIDHLIPPSPPSPSPLSSSYNNHNNPPSFLDPNTNIFEMPFDTASQAGSQTSSLPLGASALSTPPSSVILSGTGSVGGGGGGGGGGAKRSITTATALGLRPQFNVDSAATLLATFREVMLPNFPCVVLDEGMGVAELVRERPFLLLAILAAASSSRTLQGHSLYDEEFRKILGLKFVAGGERSVELLEGLVVYIAWYPFHLRPKNKQAFQYVRMAGDIISDLELDQDPGDVDGDYISPERINSIRIYLAIYFMASNYATSWNRTYTIPFNAYTSKAIDLLSTHSPLFGDAVLTWKARLQRLTEEAHDLRRMRKSITNEYQVDLILKGISSQVSEWEAKMPPAIAANPPVRIAVLFTRIFIIGAPLLKVPGITKPPSATTDTWAFRPIPAQLLSVVPTLHELYDYFLTLPTSRLNAFAGNDWGRLILAVVLGYRMSFALPDCPEWDDASARKHVRFGEYMDQLCKMGDAEDGDAIRAGLDPITATTATEKKRSLDIMGASKVVLGVVRDKFNRRVAKLEQAKKWPQPQQGMMAALWNSTLGRTQEGAFAQQQNPHQGVVMDSTMTGCPMLDGSLEAYYPYWDETFATNHLGMPGVVGRGAGGGIGGAGGGATGGDPTEQPQPQQPTSYNDLWATISMGWAQDNIDCENL